jgi:hypothetical protein
VKIPGKPILLDKVMSFFRRSVNEKTDDSARSSSNDVYSSHEIVSTKGDLKFVVEQGGNGSQPSYQEVSGAPVEAKSSLGYAVGPLTIVFINIGKMIGTGVYSTRMCFSQRFRMYSLMAAQRRLY